MGFTLQPQFWSRCVIGSVVMFATLGATAQKVDTPPDFEIGDKWTYKVQDLGNKKQAYTYSQQVIRLEEGVAHLYGETMDPANKRPKYIHKFELKRAKAIEGYAFNPGEATLVGERFGDWRSTPSWFQFPLELGRKYDYREDWSSGEGYNDYKVEIDAIERIKIQAGEFDAYRIRYTGKWVFTGRVGSTGRVEMTRWWAPSVKREVKRHYQNWLPKGENWEHEESELVMWEPKAALPAVIAKPAAAPVSSSTATAPTTSSVEATAPSAVAPK